LVSIHITNTTTIQTLEAASNIEFSQPQQTIKELPACRLDNSDWFLYKQVVNRQVEACQ